MASNLLKRGASIPEELLRRSCRRKKPQSSSESLIEGSTNDQVKHLERIRKKSKLELAAVSIKLEPTIDSEPAKANTKIGEHFKSSPSRTDTPSKCDKTKLENASPPSSDGELLVDEDELNLERTLMGGQSFRWTKHDRSWGTSFDGIIHDHALKLWRNSSTTIAFKRLNKESSLTKPSITQSLLEDYFQLKYKLNDLYKRWSECDEHLAKCCNQYKGFRILRQDPVENVFSFICATNNNIKRISQMIDKMCKRFGTILEKDDKSSVFDSFQSFPTVERLADDDVFDCLRYELGFGYRAKFINETAKQLMQLSGQKPRDHLMSLRELPYEETRKQLMKLPGIGRKVADCICLMSMDHLNSVPIDCHIYEIVCRHYMPNLRSERKTLTDNVHDLINHHFNSLHGPLAGWSTSVLFIAELKHLKSTEISDKSMDKAVLSNDDCVQNLTSKRKQKSKKALTKK